MNTKNTQIKILDDKGRIAIPKDLRNVVSFESGDVIKLIATPTEITLRKVGIVDHISNSDKDIESAIKNGFNALPLKRQIAIAKSVIETLERTQSND